MQLQHHLAACKTLPLDTYEKVAIITPILIPQWTYYSLFLGSLPGMAEWNDMPPQYLSDTRRGNVCECRRLTTHLRKGGLRLR